MTTDEKLNLCYEIQETLGMFDYDIKWDVEATKETLGEDLKGVIYYDLTSDKDWEIKILDTLNNKTEFTKVVLHELTHALMVNEYRCLLDTIDSDVYKIYSRFNEVIVDRIANTFYNLI